MRFPNWLVVAAGLALCPSLAAATAQWTVMVYMAADNDLEPYAIDDINEMEQVGSTAEVNIIVQLDRAPGYDASNGNWEDTRRFLITQDANSGTIGSPVSGVLGEKNMGDPATLREFVSWAIDNYPAQHYFLIFWDHGQGWLKARSEIAASEDPIQLKSATDQPGAVLQVSAAQAMTPYPPPPFQQTGFKYACMDLTDNDKLYNHEVQIALSSAPKLDIVGYDACVMAMVETAYQLRDEASFLVASEENEPSDGWPYNDLFSWMTTYPAYSSAQVCSLAVLTYATHETGIDGNKQTLSAIDLSQIRSVCSNLDAMVDEILSGSSWSQILAMPYPERFGDKNPFDDLYDFADLVGVYVSAPAIAGAANDLKTAISNAILISRTESDHPHAHGLSVFFPKTASAFWQNDGFLYGSPLSPVDFADSTAWSTFLYYYMGGGTYLGDAREPDDVPTQAGQPLSPLYPSQSLVSSLSDVDYWLIHTGASENLQIVLESPADADLDLRLYGEDGTTALDSSLHRGNGAPDTITWASGGPLNVYLSVKGFASYSTLPYTLQCGQTGYQAGGFLLSYDDDSPATGWYSTTGGDVIGTSFNLPSYPMVLDRVWVNFTSLAGTGSGNGSFYLLLYDNYGAIVDPIALGQLTPSALGWNYLDLSSVSPVVFTSCFVGIWYDGINSPVIGSDSYSNGRDYYYSSSAGTWQSWPSSLFIRLDVSYPIYSGIFDDEENSQLPIEFSLSQNYPNPFNSSTIIEFSLRSSGVARVAVYNVLGQEVRELANQYFAEGPQQVSWDGKDRYGRNVASGIYFYRANTNSGDATKKMILLK